MLKMMEEFEKLTMEELRDELIKATEEIHTTKRSEVGWKAYDDILRRRRVIVAVMCEKMNV